MLYSIFYQSHPFLQRCSLRLHLMTLLPHLFLQTTIRCASSVFLFFIPCLFATLELNMHCLYHIFMMLGHDPYFCIVMICLLSNIYDCCVSYDSAIILLMSVYFSLARAYCSILYA